MCPNSKIKAKQQDNINSILHACFDLEIKIATSSNPLTRLPGNLIIGFWLEESLRENRFSVLYCDLDHFKEYNDTYGFTKGDEVLKFTARMLSVFSENIPDTKLGHIGGDDFIIISHNTIDENALQMLCIDFDRRIKDFFSSKHAEWGFYHAVNRQGEKINIPLISLSIAVLTEENFNGTPHPGQLGQIAAMLKKQVKANNHAQRGSGFLFERRKHR